MAATDKPLRNQETLDVVFAVASVAMLVSALLMFAQDYFREWKPEQRVFREVESKLAQRVALQQLPSEDDLSSAEEAVETARRERKEKQPEVSDLKKQLAVLEPSREKADASPACTRTNCRPFTRRHTCSAHGPLVSSGPRSSGSKTHSSRTPLAA